MFKVLNILSWPFDMHYDDLCLITRFWGRHLLCGPSPGFTIEVITTTNFSMIIQCFLCTWVVILEMFICRFIF